jgi:hypothetical protein
MITHPFMDFYGKKFLVVGYYERANTLFLRCVEKPGDQVRMFPASITDYSAEPRQDTLESETKTHFTIQGLNDVAFILDNALGVSTQ